MCVYMWKFNTIPERMVVERFIDDQVPLFARYSKALTGADGEPVVDLMKVEHNCGVVNLEFQLNGVEGQSGDVFCFPGYFPGDMDDDGIPLFNYCDTKGYFYGQIVATVLERAQKIFDIEITSSIHEQRQFHPAW